MGIVKRWLGGLVSVVFALLSAAMTLTALAMVAVVAVYLHVVEDLPDPQRLREVHLQVPLQIYSADGRLMAEMGEKRRIPLHLAQIPQKLIQTVLAVEDDRFFEHPGVDWQGLVRAALNLWHTGVKGQGGSTITMQVARNFYLSPEKSYQRKIKEVFLAMRIEQILTKEEILEMYLNKIYFGNRAYGVGAAAQIYYGVPVESLTLPQMATIAGLPKAPSRNNPITNPARSLARRAYVLNRLMTLNKIDAAAYHDAMNTPETARIHGPEIQVEAPYLVEMVRAELIAKYGEESTYTNGLRVITTLDPARQRDADTALREGLLDYEERHGYAGPEGHAIDTLNPKHTAAVLAHYPAIAGLPLGQVVVVEGRTAQVQVQGQGLVSLDWVGLSWARRRTAEGWLRAIPHQASEVVQVGDVVRLHQTPEGKWRLAQRPEVEGALVSLNPQNGAILALTGGYDFAASKFNRAVQAARQPGSSFKPFVYAAGLEFGYTPASVFDDAPFFKELPGMPAWHPENYDGHYRGPARLREALVHSLNMVSIRLLDAIGVHYAIDYATRFGFPRERIPHNLTLALGTLVASPLEMANAYATFANGGYRVNAYSIHRITDNNGNLIFQATPPTVCPTCPEGTDHEGTKGPDGFPVAVRVVDARNVYLMNSMLRDVVRRGTATRAMRLGRSDLAGKTGTTNDVCDTWFSGFNSKVLATVWVGYDHMDSLGDGETGGRTALPIWMDYMAKALRGVPEDPFVEPPGMVTVRVDSRTGYAASGKGSGYLLETFREDHVPTRRPVAKTNEGHASDHPEVGDAPPFLEPPPQPMPEQLF